MRLKPYYKSTYITLYLGSSLELDLWTEGDVLITDPPYGLGGVLSFGSKTKPRVHETQQWDKSLEARDAVLDLWGDKPYAVFGSPKLPHTAPPFRGAPLIWDKGNVPAMGDTRFPWRPTYEVIYVSGPGWAGFRGESVLRYPHSTRVAKAVGHPTPKPIGLMEELVSKAPPGLIVDPFVGSGATLIACANLKRHCVGIELDEAYAEAAVRRIRAERALRRAS